MSSGRRVRPLLLAIAPLLLAACSAVPTAAPFSSAASGPRSTGATAGPTAALKSTLQLARARIKHVVVIMQENRSFDSYFGTYPGADGIAMSGGKPVDCVPDPATGGCVRPFHDPADTQLGGPHGSAAALADMDGGKMDGFVAQAEAGKAHCDIDLDPACGGTDTDVMGYHDRGELENYWAYADAYVLQDRMFEPNASWSLPDHLFLVSEWSAVCGVHGDPMSCRGSLDSPSLPLNSGLPGAKEVADPNYAWTDLTYLLHRSHVSWAYYVFPGSEPDCTDGEETCPPVQQAPTTPGIWNPLPYFTTVQEDQQLGNVRGISDFFSAAKRGELPAVSWIIPSHEVSEHPPASVQAGQAYVTALIDAVMSSSDWASTAVFLAWDDWGGFYDHEVPPSVDKDGYGLRVPGLLISPYARHGYIDHQILSFDAYSKLIEDLFLGGARLDPLTDGRPDSRPGVREEVGILGNLLAEFDFSQKPRQPMILPTTWTPPPG